jgi:hypothetical protein
MKAADCKPRVAAYVAHFGDPPDYDPFEDIPTPRARQTAYVVETRDQSGPQGRC